jgi:hypothetical protein
MNIQSSFLLDSETEKEEIFNVKSELSIVKNRHRRRCDPLCYQIAIRWLTRAKINGHNQK